MSTCSIALSRLLAVNIFNQKWIVSTWYWKKNDTKALVSWCL